MNLFKLTAFLDGIEPGDEVHIHCIPTTAAGEKVIRIVTNGKTSMWTLRPDSMTIDGSAEGEYTIDDRWYPGCDF